MRLDKRSKYFTKGDTRGEKWSDLGYILEINLTAFADRFNHRSGEKELRQLKNSVLKLMKIRLDLVL